MLILTGKSRGPWTRKAKQLNKCPSQYRYEELVSQSDGHKTHPNLHCSPRVHGWRLQKRVRGSESVCVFLLSWNVLCWGGGCPSRLCAGDPRIWPPPLEKTLWTGKGRCFGLVSHRLQVSVGFGSQTLQTLPKQQRFKEKAPQHSCSISLFQGGAGSELQPGTGSATVGTFFSRNRALNRNRRNRFLGHILKVTQIQKAPSPELL